MPGWREKGWTNSGSFTSEKMRGEYGASMFKRIVRQYHYNAKRRGLVVSLTESEFKALVDANCTYCGSPPSTVMAQEGAYGEYIYNGIDRVDSTKGYEAGNCTPCCQLCNKSKSNVPFDEWIAWLDRIRDFRNNV